VGKSTVASQLALMLGSDATLNIGLLDVDICGPSQPRMLGVENESLHGSRQGMMTPVYAGPNANIAVASVGFLLDEEAVIWRGPRKTGLLKTFLKDTDWSDLDFLIVDTPPGTSDEHLGLVHYLKPITGAVLVTGPQELAWQDVRKEADFCRKVNIPILCIVENMAGFTCKTCQHHNSIFPSRTEGISRWAQEHGIPFISIPLDPDIARSLDSGQPYVIEYNDSESTAAYLALSRLLLAL
jgi:Mrp family chromosome partitioning ATPase